MTGGDERVAADNLFRYACRIALLIHGEESLETAKVLMEAAKHFESRHCENGKPENSRWNRAASIPDDEQSIEARNLFHEAEEILKRNGKELSTQMAEIYLSRAKLVKSVHSEYHGEEQLHFLNLGIDTLEFALGFDHPETGEAYARMGLACQE